ncbi:MAG: hypothetical protein ABS55_02380 [Lautropia sp. SCN 70-15]|nr:MAG: hypothetical protein ABS55_02380 [Lautropia sp. SCN 70-15]
MRTSGALLAVYAANVFLGLYAQRGHVSLPWLLGNLGEATLVFVSIVLFVYAFMMVERIDGSGS